MNHILSGAECDQVNVFGNEA